MLYIVYKSTPNPEISAPSRGSTTKDDIFTRTPVGAVIGNLKKLVVPLTYQDCLYN
jgi:hypothetical protein